MHNLVMCVLGRRREEGIKWQRFITDEALQQCRVHEVATLSYCTFFRLPPRIAALTL